MAAKYRVRAITSSIVTIALLALVLFWSKIPSGFSTPADCVEAVGTASKQGQAERYLQCLAEPLRSETRQKYADLNELATALRRQMQDVKSWTQILEGSSEDSLAHVDVDLVRPAGTTRVRFRLERSSRGWLITNITPPEEIPSPIPYGVHVKDVLEDTPANRE